MKRWALLAAVAILSMSNAGCFMAVWDPNPVARTEQLLVMSEELRLSRQGIAQALFLDTPSNLNSMPMNGVVAPPAPFGP